MIKYSHSNLIEYHETFDEFIKKSTYLNSMIDFVESGKNFTPDNDKVFRFFSCNLDNIKVVILGMDPYNSTYIKNGEVHKVATGRAFEVANIENFTDSYRQTSLANIFKALAYIKYGKVFSMSELRKKFLDEKSDNEKLEIEINIKKFFDTCEKNGIMFLNASLTTMIGVSGAHKKVWEPFMNELFNYILNKTKNVKWLIWGRDARERVQNIVKNENIYYSCHPATRVNNDFVTHSNLDKIKSLIF